MVICPFLTYEMMLAVQCRSAGELQAANFHLPFSDTDEPPGLAQVPGSASAIEKKLPLLFFGESSSQMLPQAIMSSLRCCVCGKVLL